MPSALAAHTTSPTNITNSSSANEERLTGNTTEPPDTKQDAVQKLPEPTVSEQRLAESSLWALAYECFQREDPKLAEKFSNCLGVDLADLSTGLGRVKQKALEKINEAQDSKDSLYKTPLGRYLKKAVEIIIASKDFIGSAVSAEPHAALAWCGVSLLLPVSIPDIVIRIIYLMLQKLFLNPYQENEASQKGLADVTTLMTVYEWQEKTYLHHDDAKSSFKDSLIGLYTMMLSYQATLLVHLRQNSPTQWLDSVVKAGDWSSRLEDIRGQDAKCRFIANAISEYLREKWHIEETKWQQDLLQQPRLAEENNNLKKLYSNYEAGKNVNPARVPGTCRWFLDHPGFLTWRKSQSSRLLWLSADPGCGKSVLAKYLVDRRGEAMSIQNTEPTVCYFFFKDGDTERRDAAKAVCALLHQLFLQQPQLYRHAKEDFRTKSDSFLTDLDNVWNILMKAVEDFAQVETVFVLDALDECQESSRKALVDKLVRLYRHQDTINDSPIDNRRPIVKFLVTSRPEINIIRDFDDLTEVRLRGEEESEQISQEIDLVIDKRIQDIGKRLRLGLFQQSSLRNNLTSITQRTYLWLHLTFDAIEKKLMLTKKDIAAILSVIPKNVDQAYTAILDKSRDKELARKLLHIILVAKRPLSLKEINVALVIDDCHECYDDLEIWSPVGSADLVKNICGLFISVVDSKVYLIHQTAREFLLGENRGGWSKSFRLAESNLVLAKACVWLLRLRDFDENDLRASKVVTDVQTDQEAIEDAKSDENILSKGEPSLKKKSYILYKYAACFWKDHFVEAADLPEAALIKVVAHKLCDTTSHCFQNWNHLSQKHAGAKYLAFRDPSSLTVASYLGLTAVVKVLLNHGSQTNFKSRTGRTPLYWAASEGHVAVAELLLEQGARLDLADQEGFTPLLAGVSEGHEEMVNLLLDRGAEVESLTDGKLTPLHLATDSETIVNLLLSRGAHVDPLSEEGATPLFYAIGQENESVCKLLLKSGARTDITDIRGRTVLHDASREGSIEVVQLFLDQGVPINHRDDTGQTPLFDAVASKHPALVELLLKAGARTDIADNQGKTLLHHAAYEKKEVVCVFLDRDVEVNFQDYKGQTALFVAAEEGNTGVVKLLLERGARTDLKDKEGRTPYSIAGKNRETKPRVLRINYDQVLKLLERDGGSE